MYFINLSRNYILPIPKPYHLISAKMKIEFNNLYTHFIFSTFHRLPVIPEKNRERIEKYITGVINNNDSRLYAIYANPEHVHFLVSRTPKLSEETLASIIAESSQKFINQYKLCNEQFAWQDSAAAFSVSKSAIDPALGGTNTSLISPNIIAK